jgi:hypothetical protein
MSILWLDSLWHLQMLVMMHLYTPLFLWSGQTEELTGPEDKGWGWISFSLFTNLF